MFTVCRPPFHWTEAHDISFCCELRNIKPYQYKSGTRESGSASEQIAKNLNSFERPKFSVNKRSVRDRYNVLRGNFMRKMSYEERSSGIDVEDRGIDQLLQEICACAKEYELRINVESEASLARKNEDQITAEEIRGRSMETFSQTAKRKPDEEKKTNKKTRQGGNQTVTYLREKLEKETEIRKKELELRRTELEAEKHKQEAKEEQQMRMSEQQTNVLKAFNMQMERQVQQQENQQQFAQVIIQSQQQQTAALMALIEKINQK